MIETISRFFIGACANRFRGEEGNLWNWSDRFNATLCFAAAIYLQTHDVVSAASCAIGYLFFISPGWGAYFIHPEDFSRWKDKVTVGARYSEIEWIDGIVVKLSRYSLWQNFWGMTLRGLYLLPAFALMGYANNSLFSALAGFILFPLAMGLSYLIPAWVAYKKPNWTFEYTGYAEGLVGGFALGMLGAA